MNSIRSQLQSGQTPSAVFRALFQGGTVTTHQELIDLLFHEFSDFSPSAAIATLNWSRLAQPSVPHSGLSDERLDEILANVWPTVGGA